MNKVKAVTQPGRPPAALELSTDGALAAAIPAAGEQPVYAFASLPAGALAPSIEHANLRLPQAVAEAIRAALDQASPRSRSVTLVVPDTSVRVFVLDFDTLSAKASEAIPVLRFRLRKMVPFDVEQAGVSYQILSQSKSECKVLTAVMPGPILAEYEAAVRAADYEPGVVLPSSLAALEMAGSYESVLAANLSDSAITTLIATGQDLLLYRTLELPDSYEERLAEIRRSIAVAAAYYEDKLGAPARALYYTGNRDAPEFADWLGDSTLAVMALSEPPSGGVLTPLGHGSVAAVAGALALAGAQAGTQ